MLVIPCLRMKAPDKSFNHVERRAVMRERCHQWPKHQIYQRQYDQRASHGRVAGNPAGGIRRETVSNLQDRRRCGAEMIDPAVKPPVHASCSGSFVSTNSGLILEYLFICRVYTALYSSRLLPRRREISFLFQLPAAVPVKKTLLSKITN